MATPPARSGPPRTTPIGLKLASTAKIVGRAFEAALEAVGGSRPAWLILISLKARRLASLEGEGIVVRRRDPHNRRVHLVELTSRADEAFERMRGAAAAFDRRLRRGIGDDEVTRLADLLDQLAKNVEEK